MTGEEVIRMFKELNINDIYPASGITQTYLRNNMKNYLRNIELWDGIKKSKLIWIRLIKYARIIF